MTNWDILQITPQPDIATSTSAVIIGERAVADVNIESSAYIQTCSLDVFCDNADILHDERLHMIAFDHMCISRRQSIAVIANIAGIYFRLNT